MSGLGRLGHPGDVRCTFLLCRRSANSGHRPRSFDDLIGAAEQPIKESRSPAPRRDDHLRRLDRQAVSHRTGADLRQGNIPTLTNTDSPCPASCRHPRLKMRVKSKMCMIGHRAGGRSRTASLGINPSEARARSNSLALVNVLRIVTGVVRGKHSPAPGFSTAKAEEAAVLRVARIDAVIIGEGLKPPGHHRPSACGADADHRAS
jgi:hypothetical protein